MGHEPCINTECITPVNVQEFYKSSNQCKACVKSASLDRYYKEKDNPNKAIATKSFAFPKIEKGVPVPDRYKTRKEILINYIKSMEVGDSVYFNNIKEGERFDNYIRKLVKELQYFKEFCRERDDNGIRIWRIK